jgi:regulator of RNase E activity RraA
VFFGDAVVTRGDYAFADADGVLFLGAENLDEVLRVAAELRTTEREQVQRLSRGITLREQFQFTEYLERRKQDSSYTFREHLRRIGRAIEE